MCFGRFDDLWASNDGLDPEILVSDLIKDGPLAPGNDRQCFKLVISQPCLDDSYADKPCLKKDDGESLVDLPNGFLASFLWCG